MYSLDIASYHEESPEVIALLKERIEKWKEEKLKMYPAEEVEDEIRQLIETRKKNS